MKNNCRLALATTIALLALTPANAQTAFFGFEDIAENTITTFNMSNNGVGVEVASNNDPGGFVVTPSDGFFVQLTGNALSTSSGGTNFLFLFFDRELTSISVDFATEQSELITLETALAEAVVGSDTEFGSVLPNGLFPEGTLSFTGGPFDAVAIFLGNGDPGSFVIDNVRIGFDAATAPEPGSLALLSLGILGITLARRSPR